VIGSQPEKAEVFAEDNNEWVQAVGIEVVPAVVVVVAVVLPEVALPEVVLQEPAPRDKLT